MKKSIKTGILFLFMSLFAQQAYSQFSTSYYYPNVVSFDMGFSSAENGQFATGLKLFTNRELKYISAELDVMYRFKAGDYHRFAMGLGFKTDPFTEAGVGNTLLLPMQLEVFPFSATKKVSFMFELAPEYLFSEIIRIRSLFGLRYTFN